MNLSRFYIGSKHMALVVADFSVKVCTKHAVEDAPGLRRVSIMARVIRLACLDVSCRVSLGGAHVEN